MFAHIADNNRRKRIVKMYKFLRRSRAVTLQITPVLLALAVLLYVTDSLMTHWSALS